MSSPTCPFDDSDLILPEQVDEPIGLRLLDTQAGRDPTNWGERLAVFVGGADSYHEQRLPIAGRYERRGHVLSFIPAFALVVGQEYVVCSRRNADPLRLTEFRIGLEATGAQALVTGVYPSGDVLPENVLRFYVHFSAPMTPHLASGFVTLRNEDGAVDHGAFMKFKQELWNADRTRLTVLIDPGRIKRSVATNLDLGPALLEGERYAFTVGEGWPSADGRSLLPAFTKDFSVAEALRERPSIERWTWRPPTAETREPVTITFDRPFDRHRLGNAIYLTTGDGQTINGTSAVGENETSWTFTPNEPWTTSDIAVAVDDALEDVAGNNIRELLDQKIRPR